MTKSVKHRLMALVVGAATLLSGGGCSLIDEDLSECGADFTLNYELRLVTNMTTEIGSRLNSSSDAPAKEALQGYLGGIFSDFAHDVDLSFYDVAGDSALLHHEERIMDGSTASFTLYLPARQYDHLAVLNVQDDGAASLVGGDSCHSSRLVEAEGDTVECQKTGLFSARLPMDVETGENQAFKVNLYMANCASVLVVDTLGSGIRDLKVYETGFATEFAVADSLYSFGRKPVYMADKVETQGGHELCFATVSFPSLDTRTKSVIETEEPFEAKASDKALWRYKAYATLPDGKVTETVLGSYLPLRAGQLKILKAKAHPNGSLTTDDTAVGVSVTLDWNPGIKFDDDL